MPGSGEFGPACSPQHDSDDWLSAPSDVMTSKPSFLNAGDEVMRGTQTRRNASTDFSPPGLPSAHGSSCPSLQRSGVMKLSAGVVDARARSSPRCGSGTTLRVQELSSMTLWK